MTHMTYLTDSAYCFPISSIAVKYQRLYILTLQLSTRNAYERGIHSQSLFLCVFYGHELCKKGMINAFLAHLSTKCSG